MINELKRLQHYIEMYNKNRNINKFIAINSLVTICEIICTLYNLGYSITSNWNDNKLEYIKVNELTVKGDEIIL